MGILNVTPDSFSDGSELGDSSDSSFSVDLEKVGQRAEAMLADGAQILDIGGESTRPGAKAISPQEELDRVIPVIELLRSKFDAFLSVDTSSPEVMAEAISQGVHMINDIRALNREAAIETIAASQVAICLMHMQGQPRTMQQTYHYEDVVQEVSEFLQARVSECLAAGIDRGRLVVDPGFGFGKSVAHNFALLRGLDKLLALELPILAGISRKSMLGAVTDKAVGERLAASVAAATLALQGGAKIIRAHDVAATVDAIRVHCAYIDSE
ncbi:MAG: dihydropteroate synthase [Pseudomonadales bacterium]|nr:dihydropteroate synthase [Pseudomonadales bacterium]